MSHLSAQHPIHRGPWSRVLSRSWAAAHRYRPALSCVLLALLLVVSPLDAQEAAKKYAKNEAKNPKTATAIKWTENFKEQRISALFFTLLQRSGVNISSMGELKISSLQSTSVAAGQGGLQDVTVFAAETGPEWVDGGGRPQAGDAAAPAELYDVLLPLAEILVDRYLEAAETAPDEDTVARAQTFAEGAISRMAWLRDTLSARA